MDEIVFEQDKTMKVLFEWKQMGECLLAKSQDISTSDIFGLRIKPRHWKLMSDIVQLCQCWLIFTKPCNGSLFRKFRDVILGYKPVSSLREILPSDVEEHVGNNDQRLLGRHNVSESDTSKYKGVTRDVAIVAGKDSMKINNSCKDEFIKSNESS